MVSPWSFWLTRAFVHSLLFSQLLGLVISCHMSRWLYVLRNEFSCEVVSSFRPFSLASIDSLDLGSSFYHPLTLDIVPEASADPVKRHLGTTEGIFSPREIPRSFRAIRKRDELSLSGSLPLFFHSLELERFFTQSTRLHINQNGQR